MNNILKFSVRHGSLSLTPTNKIGCHTLIWRSSASVAPYYVQTFCSNLYTYSSYKYMFFLIRLPTIKNIYDVAVDQGPYNND